MSIGDIFYIFAIVLFSIMTFAIIRGNFRRKFNEHGERLDLIEKEKTQEKDSGKKVKNKEEK